MCAWGVGWGFTCAYVCMLGVRVRVFVCAHVRVYDCVCNAGLACLASSDLNCL